jgi:uncharacterized protein (DUF983 family)
MKLCKLCGEQKPLSDFYSQVARCKECHKAAMAKRRAENLDAIRAYDRARGSLPHRVEARTKFQKTDAYKRSHKDATAKYVAKHPKRRAAQIAVGNAIRDGRLAKKPCQVCGCERTEAHHPDYDAPLDVVWLCVPHHVEVHQLVETH